MLFLILSLPLLVALLSILVIQVRYLWPLFFLMILISKNILASYLSVDMDDAFVLNVIKALDFVYVVAAFSYVILQRVIKHKYLTAYENILVIFLLVYFLIGVINTDVKSSLVYFRLIIYPFLLLYIGIYIGQSGRSASFILPVIVFVSVIISGFLLIELFYTHQWLSMINMDAYLSLKRDMYYSVEDVVRRQTRTIFNLGFAKDYRVYRPLGMALHSISSSYIFAVFGAILFTLNYRVVGVVLMLVSLLFGVKGVLLAIFFSFAVYMIKQINFNSYKTNLLIMIIYLTGIMVMGLKSNNPHMYELLGAVKNIDINVFGGGIGFGGVMSSAMRESHLAHGDSVVALMLSSIGVIGFFIVYGYYFKVHSKYYHNKKIPFLVIFSTFVLLNAFFQEEAFNPYALPMCMLFIGIIYEKNIRSGFIRRSLDTAESTVAGTTKS